MTLPRSAPFLAGLLLLTGLFLAALLLDFRIPDEDAYISYVYSESLVAGHGLTYRGVKVEGYTNPLTVLGTALVSGLTGLPVANVGFALSAAWALVAVAFFFALLYAEFGRLVRPAVASLGATAATAILLINPLFLYWGFSGMENSLSAALALMALCAWRREARFSFLVCLGILPIVRYDGIVLTLTWFGLDTVWTWWRTVRDPGEGPGRRARGIGLAGAAIVFGPFALSVAWRLGYYGDSVPNTAYVKFLNREPTARLLEGALYCWNNLLASKSLLFLAAIAVVALYRVRRPGPVALFALVGALASALHMTLVGGDVAWKPFFRFGYVFNLLVLLAYFLTTWSRRAALNATSIIIAAVLVGFIHTDDVPSTGGYWTSSAFRTLHLHPSYGLMAFARLPDLPAAAARRARDLYDDFVEDVLAATGKLLRRTAGADDVLITTCAGKVVYYSGLKTIDVGNLANRDWRTYDQPRRQEVVRDAAYLVFNSNDGNILEYLRPRTAKRLVAVVYSHSLYPGLYLFVFANTALVNPPPSLGERWRYTRYDVAIDGDPVAYYTDELRGLGDIETARAAYRRLVE